MFVALGLVLALFENAVPTSTNLDTFSTCSLAEVGSKYTDWTGCTSAPESAMAVKKWNKVYMKSMIFGLGGSCGRFGLVLAGWPGWFWRWFWRLTGWLWLTGPGGDWPGSGCARLALLGPGPDSQDWWVLWNL